jgi:hypothetical protein|tara:strand:+ start:3322 stop:3528 length:207 start_codon:yes stop_codon:yes gene_type:complete
MIEVFGYIMLTVNILANGTIQGEAVNYYASYEECFVDAARKFDARVVGDVGIGYVCVEDYIDYGTISQ